MSWLRGKNCHIGIAKRLGRNFMFPGDSIPLYLDKKSEMLKNNSAITK